MVQAVLLFSMLAVLDALPEAPAGESHLLHRRIDLSALRAWLPGQAAWRPQPPPDATILIVYIWDVDCQKCIVELPYWRNILHEFQQGSSKDQRVQFLFVSETLDTPKLEQFLTRNRQRVPDQFIYQIMDNKIRQKLGMTAQPITLLLDANFNVRQAFIGNILKRRSELIGAIERLLVLLDPSTDKAAGI